ncbi:GGDEF domain-containing protein [Meiothermus rufus]|uniref:GGDEF domain-containing protein n=1 Tax=Meiothermus rufus TaxID=604332 RepID=UPI000420F179|nr:sensor domain-containing diguanylate cyclase [Meiothermus rufus]
MKAPPPLEPDTLRWLEQLPEAAVWLDEAGRIGWGNPTAKALFPHGLGQRLEELLSPQVPQAGEWFPQNLLGLAGQRWRWFQLSRAPYKNGQLCLLHEVTPAYHQALAYASSLEVLSNLLAQEARFEETLQRVLQTAVAVVPGAEAGSLALLEQDQFRFVAQIGFEDELTRYALSYERELEWYGLGEEAWRQGIPRLLVAPQIQERSRQAAPDPGVFERIGRLEELKATITVPIVLHGKVMGTLNLDALSSTEAFPPESLSIAQTFALQAATVLYGLLLRRHLSDMALRDALTGLGNRHALEEGFVKAKALAERLELPLTLIYWDMNGLKRINDQYGHATGDQALRLLGRALRGAVRQEDQAFRIGGDEFVTLHLGLPLAEAPEVIERVRSEIHVEVSAGAIEVTARMDLAAALEKGDAAMYADKRGTPKLDET